jgi:hypothetical protein
VDENELFNWLIAAGTLFIVCGVWIWSGAASWRRRRRPVQVAVDRLRAEEAAWLDAVALAKAQRAELQAVVDAQEPVVHEAELIAFEEWLRASKPRP